MPPEIEPLGEGTTIVREIMRDYLVWLGELPPEEGWCSCVPFDLEDPGIHPIKDHNDCGQFAQNRCGGCYGCLSMQYWYYREKEEEAARHG